MADNIVQHPRAELLAHKMKRAAIEAAEKEDRVRHKKWLKETKPKRDRQRSTRKREVAALSHIIDVIWRAASAKASKVSLSGPGWDAAFSEGFLTIADAVERAAEAAAAKAAGFESWAAFEAAADEAEMIQTATKGACCE